jgi:tetratricopeptide (TPR) repeat protein
LLKVKPNNIAYELKVKANKFREENSYNKAVKEYLSAILADNNDFESYLGLGISYKYLNKIDKAIYFLDKALKLNNKNSDIYYELGICHLLCGEICQAMHNLIRCIQIDKQNYNAQIQLAIAHEAIGEPQMALMIYKKIMEENPSYIKAYEHASFVLMDMKRYKEAGKILSKLIHIYPECVHAYLGLGVCFEKLNNISSAKRYYKKFVAMSSDKEQKDFIQNKISSFDLPTKNCEYLSLL